MCIICAKPANIKFPDMDTVRNMWYGNPDGAGIMYPTKKGRVQIEKGFMKLSDFEKRLASLTKEIDLDKTPVVMHFRITTHGGTTPGNTHPFPLTDSVDRLKLTRVTSSVGIAHNGIIHSVSPRRGISDTMEYIATQLAPLSRALPDWYHNQDALTLVRNGIDSKLAVLTGDGEIVTIGEFNTNNGIMYSNYSWQGHGSRSASAMWTYAWDDYAPWEADTKTKSKGKKGKGKKKKPEALTVQKAPLMWLALADEGAYVKTASGMLVEGEDFLMDADGKLYIYDIGIDAALPADDYTAFNVNGLPLTFNEDLATVEYIAA